MIYVYVCSIVLVSIIIILFFLFIRKNGNEQVKNLKQERYNQQTKLVKQEPEEKEEVKEVKEEKVDAPILEDFEWEKQQAGATEEQAPEKKDENYERFLQDDYVDEDDDEFDFSELLGKTNEEIMEIIKKYPPEVQEIVMDELKREEQEED